MHSYLLIHSPASRQRGVVLIISLLLLVVMTIIGVNSLTTTTLQEKMAGNMLNSNVAFQAAETALQEGEGWLNAQTSRSTPISGTGACGAPPCDVFEIDGLGDLPDLGGKDHAWWTTNGKAPANTLVPQVASDPRYVIEEIQFIPDSLGVGQISTGRYFYRVTARGTGGNNSAQVFVQTTFVRRY